MEETAPRSAQGSTAAAARGVCRAAPALALVAAAAAVGFLALGKEGAPHGATSSVSAGDGTIVLASSHHRAHRRHLTEDSVPGQNADGELCSPNADIPAMNVSVQGLGISDYWKELCEEVAAPLAARTTWPGQSACWERLKQEGCFAGDGRLSWSQAQENLARKGLVPFPEIVPIRPLRRADLCQSTKLGAAAENADSEEVRGAKAWLNATVAVYVISFAEEQGFPGGRAGESLSAMGVAYEVLQGVDLAKHGAYKRARDKGTIPTGFDFDKAETASQTTLQGMDGIAGAVGHAATHLQAMQNASASGGSKPLVLILEEDATVVMDFAMKLKRLVQWEVPCDWVAVSLQSACPYGECVSKHLTRVRPNGNEPEERCHHGGNFGLYAMLYRKVMLPPLVSRLERTVWDEDRPRCLDVDVALASLANEVAYYAVPKVQVPGLIVGGGDESSRRKNMANVQVQLEDDEKGGRPDKKEDNNDKNVAREDSGPLFYYATTTVTTSTSTVTSSTTSTTRTTTTITSTVTTSTTEAPKPWYQFW